MDNLYRDFILEHYRNPHNKGYLDPHDLHFADSNPTCGDEMSMTLRLDQGQAAIADVDGDADAAAESDAHHALRRLARDRRGTSEHTRGEQTACESTPPCHRSSLVRRVGSKPHPPRIRRTTRSPMSEVEMPLFASAERTSPLRSTR